MPRKNGNRRPNRGPSGTTHDRDRNVRAVWTASDIAWVLLQGVVIVQMFEYMFPPFLDDTLLELFVGFGLNQSLTENDSPVRLLPGPSSAPETNLRQLLRDGGIDAIGTGYALDEGIWWRHSWGFDRDGTLIETTRLHDRYLGLTFQGEKSGIFALTPPWFQMPSEDELGEDPLLEYEWHTSDSEARTVDDCERTGSDEIDPHLEAGLIASGAKALTMFAETFMSTDPLDTTPAERGNLAEAAFLVDRALTLFS